MALTSRLTLRAETSNTSALDLATATTALDYLKRLDWTSGTGANQADLIWHDRRTLNASTAEDLDLAGGVTNEFGTALTFARVKGIIVHSLAANGGLIQVGGDGSAAFINWVASATDIVNIRPGGLFALFAPDATGYAVTGTTADLLQVNNANAGGTGTYEIVIIGASA